MIRKKAGVFLPGSTSKYWPMILVLTAIFTAVPVFTDSRYILTIFSLILIYGILAMSIDLLAGYMGLASLGQAAFFGVGAYSAAYIMTKTSLSFAAALILALLTSALVGVIFGLLVLKTWGTTFLMVNMALAQIIWGFSMKLNSITGGEAGITGIPRPTILGFSFKKPVAMYYLLVVSFALVIFLLYRLVNSPFGLVLIGMKQSRNRMGAIGFNNYKYKLIGYVISAVIAGFAGILFAVFNQFVSPPDVSTLASSKAFLMAMLGGTGSLVGPMLGSAAVVFLQNYVSTITARWNSILGVLYIAIVMFSPGGFMSIFQKIKDAFSRKKTDRAAEL